MKQSEVLRLVLLFFGLSKKYTDEHSSSITVDEEISATSQNPVQNKVIKSALDLKANAASLGNKLDKDQGAENAGKFMIVGGNGKIVPVEMQAWQGGEY